VLLYRGSMIEPDPFREQVTLSTASLRLEPLGPEHLEGTWTALQDPDTRRLAGIHEDSTRESTLASLAERKAAADRADWAIIRVSDGLHLGEVTLFDLDRFNAHMRFRIALTHPAVFGKGYGSEATKAVVDYGLGELGLHRIWLVVADFNTRAQRVYAKNGFSPEGILHEAWFWDGEYSDAILMAAIRGGR
jgi:RimJ/RimL family protein N-acetyltransferase